MSKHLVSALPKQWQWKNQVVAYNIRGVRDLVVDGETGFLVKFGDINALADKIIFLMEHPNIAKAMGKEGRKRIEENFSLDIILKEMKELYNDICLDRPVSNMSYLNY